MKSLRKFILFLLLCLSCAIDAMQQRNLFLPHINEKARQEVLAYIENAPEEIVAQFRSYAPIAHLNKSNRRTALAGLGELYRSEKKFDHAEAAFRMEGSADSCYRLGHMFAIDCPCELKARAYYLAAGHLLHRFGSPHCAYADLANMLATDTVALKENGFDNQDAIKHRIEDAIKLFWLAGCFGSEESMRSVIGLSDFAENNYNFSPSPAIRFAAYKKLLENKDALPAIQESFHRFVKTNNVFGIDPLPSDYVKQLRQELDEGTQSAVEVIDTLHDEAGKGNRHAQFQLAETLFWSLNPSDKDLIEAIKLYILVLNGLHGDLESQFVVIDRLKAIGNRSSQLRSQLIFSILDTVSSNLFGAVFEESFANHYKGGIIEYIEQNEHNRFDELVQKGNPLALCIKAVILTHQASLTKKIEEQHELLNQALNVAQKGAAGGIDFARQLIENISAKLSKLYREAHDYEKSYAVLSSCLPKKGLIPTMSRNFLDEYALLCLEKPAYLTSEIMPLLSKIFCVMKNDFRAKCCVCYGEFCKTYDPCLRTKFAYDFIQTILSDENQRTYFFTNCPDFVVSALRKACEDNDPNACYVYCLLSYITNKSDEKASEFLASCADQQDPWVGRMRESFEQLLVASSSGNDALVIRYCELAKLDDEHKRNCAFSLLKILAKNGNVRSCCELFLIGCANNDESLFNQMFLLIKNNKVDQKAALAYFKEHAQEELQHFGATNVKAAYLFALIQSICADECKEKDVQWCAFARSAFDNFVHAHKGQYPCDKKITVIGCNLIDYYQQRGDRLNSAAIKATVSQFCKIEQITTHLIEKLNEPTISDKSAQIIIELLDELAAKRNGSALEFMGYAYASGKKLPSGFCIEVDQEKALARLNELLKVKPDNCQACYDVARLLIARGTTKEPTSTKQISDLLSKAKCVGIHGADRLLLIVRLNDKQLTDQARHDILAQLKKYADEGDQEAKNIIENAQKGAEAKERQRLLKIINRSHAANEHISAALSRLAELAHNDAETQWQLIEWYVQQKTLLSGYVCKQDQMETLKMLFDYVEKVKLHPQSSKYIIGLIRGLPDDKAQEQFEIAYKLLLTRKQREPFESDQLRDFGYICYETHRYHEALESFNALGQISPQVSWLQAVCYLHDGPANKDSFELALKSLTKALCINGQGKLVLSEFPEAQFIIQKLNEQFRSPRANALLARLIYVANFPMPKRQWPLDVELHDAAGMRHEDPCAQSLLAYLYRSGNHVHQSVEQAVYILEQLFANPHLTEEIKHEAYDQLDQIIQEFLSMVGAIHLSELTYYLKAIYLFIPLVAPYDPAKAIECYKMAQANCIEIFRHDKSMVSMAHYEIFALEQASGSYKTLKGLAQSGNFDALYELVIGLFARYTAELKRKAEIEKKITTGQTDQHVEQVKAELHELVELFINNIRDKKIFADLKTDSATRNVVNNLFDAVIEIMKATGEPVEKFCPLLQQAIEFNPKDASRASELWNLICYKEGNAHLFLEKCLPILEQFADRNAAASLSLYYTYAPHWGCRAAQCVDKDLEKALKYLVQAARLGAVDAESFLKEASELTIDVDGYSIYGNHDEAFQAKAVLSYVSAKGHDGDNKQRSCILSDLEDVVHRFRLPIAALVAAMQYQKLYDDRKAYAMLVELIKITHGILPRIIVDDFVDVVQNFARSDDPEIKSFVGKIGNCLAAARIKLASRKDFAAIMPKSGVTAILDDLVSRT